MTGVWCRRVRPAMACIVEIAYEIGRIVQAIEALFVLSIIVRPKGVNSAGGSIVKGDPFIGAQQRFTFAPAMRTRGWKLW